MPTLLLPRRSLHIGNPERLLRVRRFDGIDDEVRVAAGPRCNLGYGTLAAVVKRNSTAFNSIIALHTSNDSPGTAAMAMEISNNAGGNRVIFGTNSGLDSSTASVTVVNADGWVLIAVTKGSGTVTPRHHKYTYSTGAWVHAAGDRTKANAALPTLGGTIRFGEWQDTDDFNGSLAIAAMFPYALADAELEQLPLNLENWFKLGPAGLWVFNQADPAQHRVLDLTRGGSDQIMESSTGTTVAALDVPLVRPYRRLDHALISPHAVGEPPAGGGGPLAYSKLADSAVLVGGRLAMA